MRLFLLCLLIDLFLVILIGYNIEANFLITLFLCITLFSFFTSISFIFTALVSLLLGKTSKRLLKKNNSYKIVFICDDYINVDTGNNTIERLPIEKITKTFYIDGITCPELIVNKYNYGGWQNKWLMQVYPDSWEYILKLPKAKTED